jgi:hypothetical protein
MWAKTMKIHGLYRIRDAWIGLTTQLSIRVRYSDGKELEIPEDQYRVQEYQPPFDALQWKEQSPPTSAGSEG